jgi:hypothetical protein
MAESKGPWWLPIALAAFSMVVSGYVGYTSNDKEIVQRVSKIEARDEERGPRLERIENKIDRLTEAVLKVLH